MISPIRKPANCDAHICSRYIKLIIFVTSPSPEMEFYARLYLRKLSVRSRAVACYHTVQARMTEYLLLTSAQFAEYYDFPVIYGDYLQGVASPRFSHPNSISPSALILLEFMQYKCDTTVAPTLMQVKKHVPKTFMEVQRTCYASTLKNAGILEKYVC